MQKYDLGNFGQIAYALPDIFIGLSIFTLIIIRLLFGREYAKKISPKFATISSFCGLLLTLIYGSINEIVFTKLFVYDYFSYYTKIILLFFSFICVFTLSLKKKYSDLSSSLYVMIFGIIISLMICLSANNFLILLIGLEGYTVSVCFLLMLNRGDSGDRLNAIRFLILSAIMTAIFFYGISLYYSNFGSFLFSDIKSINSVSFIIGILMILSAILFKLSAAPFHTWTIDIYEKANWPLVLFFDTVSKLFMLLIFAKICVVLIGKNIIFHQKFLSIVSILSMVIGGILPLRQKNIKKFIAYASIGHIGFAMTVFATTNEVASFRFAITYMISYVISAFCLFAAILTLRKNRKIETFKEIQGLVQESPILAYTIVISIFAMAGVPPFMNFIAKMEVFKVLILKGEWGVLIIACLYSIILIVYTAKCLRYVFIKKPKAFEVKEIITKNAGVILAILVLILSSISYAIIDDFVLKIMTGIK